MSRTLAANERVIVAFERWLNPEAAIVDSPAEHWSVECLDEAGKGTNVPSKTLAAEAGGLRTLLLAPSEGTISVGGRCIDRWGLQNYRSIVGAVMQDDQLFAGSVADNIAFGEEAIDQERVETAARLAA